MRHKTYVGKRDEDGVTVEVVESGVPRDLDPGPSQKLRNHSPDGFEWGYGGSGPAQLSLAILLDYFEGAREGEPSRFSQGSPDASAQFFYQRFKFAVVAGLPKDGWELTTNQVEHALRQIVEGK